MSEIQRKNQQNPSRASFVDGRGRNHRWSWSAIPVNLRNLLWNMLFRCHYRVMTGKDEGLDACIHDLAIQQWAVATQHCPRLKRTRELPVIVGELTASFPWETFRHAYGILGRKDRIFQRRHGLESLSQVRLA